jgi:predicted AlkP superfamily pyrophosphatase or phosphodiesterase
MRSLPRRARARARARARGRRTATTFAAALLLAALLGCWSEPPAAPPDRTLVLVSLDGFRADYLERLPAPNLRRLAADGVRAERLIPSFPTKTFPNHFTLVTGRYPEHHGIVGNDIYDPGRDAWFSLGNRQAVGDGRWWQAEPLWVTAQRHGMRTAPLFWPGSEAALEGVRPTTWLPFDGDLSAAARVRRILDLLARPPAERPRFVTLYLEDVDSAGHDHGPDSEEVAAAVAFVDAAVGALLDGLARLGIAAATDVVVVSDHGMAATPADQVIYLDDLLDPRRVRVVAWSPVLQLWPPPERLAATLAALRGKHPHLAVYGPGELPRRLHYRDSERIPPVVALAAEGWQITTRERAERREPRAGQHGYDPTLPSMGALFVAAGPSFRTGVVLPPFENVQVYPLLCAALGVPPVPGDWTLEGAPPALRGRR